MDIKLIYSSKKRFLIIFFLAYCSLKAGAIEPSIFIGVGGGIEIFKVKNTKLDSVRADLLNLLSSQNRSSSIYALPLSDFSAGIRADSFLQTNNFWLDQLKLGVKGFINMGLGLSPNGYKSNIIRLISLYTSAHIGFFNTFLYAGLGFEHINNSESIIPNSQYPIIYKLDRAMLVSGAFYDFNERNSINFSYRFRLFSNNMVENYRLMINYEYRF